jgi:RNA polymerase sigma-70 factor (ECF subfamily)
MTSLTTDSGLVAAFARGDTRAGDALFARHAASLRAFLAARCRDADLAGELVQEVALKLVTAAPGLDPERDVRAYLFQVAANVWRDHLRKELVRERAQVRLAGQASITAAPTDERLLEQELRDAVRRAVATLPVAQRQVLELRQRSDLTFREIAERLRRPLGTVLGQMRAALEKIDAALEDYR